MSQPYDPVPEGMTREAWEAWMRELGDPDYVRQLPVRLCCGQRHSGAVCPDGLVMCCICFSRFETGQLYVDKDGDWWDICTGCAGTERARNENRRTS